jgi:hypothetical protein
VIPKAHIDIMMNICPIKNKAAGTSVVNGSGRMGIRGCRCILLELLIKVLHFILNP